MAKRKRSPNQSLSKKKKVVLPKKEKPDVVKNVLNDSEASLNSLSEKLKQVQTIANKAEAIATGNTVEENLKKSFPDDNPGDEINDDGTKKNIAGEEETTDDEKPKGKKRGRKKKIKSSSVNIGEADEYDDTPRKDQIATMLNGLAVPFVAKFTGKDAMDLMFTDEQQAQSVKLMPEDSFFEKPSWTIYFLNLAGQGVSNFIKAGDDRMKRMEKRVEIILSVIDKSGNEQLKAELDSKFAEAEATQQ